MSKEEIKKIFNDKKIIKKIQEKLPYLFQLAEIDNSRDGKLGMEIGSARERILIAMLIYNYGEDNVKTDIPITEKETDVILFDEPISIKTLTNKKLIGVKLIWTVDAEKAKEFIKDYVPEADMLLVQLNWNSKGAMYLLTKDGQKEVLNKLGRNNYFKLPKAGTNPRGVEISNEAINLLAKHKTSLKIDIDWNRDKNIKYDAYERWVDRWNEK
jgi:hypothetical protein